MNIQKCVIGATMPKPLSERFERSIHYLCKSGMLYDSKPELDGDAKTTVVIIGPGAASKLVAILEKACRNEPEMVVRHVDDTPWWADLAFIVVGLCSLVAMVVIIALLV